VTGLAAYGALIFIELCGTPAFALEAGMLRHGPVEAFGANLGLVAFRTADRVAPLTRALVSSAHGCGCPSVVIETDDLVDEVALDHRLRIAVGRRPLRRSTPASRWRCPSRCWRWRRRTPAVVRRARTRAGAR
jgi:fructoselysine-6-P-deglycase FrlB-like protein